MDSLTKLMMHQCRRVLVAALLFTVSPAALSDVDLSDYSLVFSDEFNGATLDDSKWNTGYLWGPYLSINNEEQLYVDTLGINKSELIENGGDTPNPFELTGDSLIIRASEVTDVNQVPERPPQNAPIWDQYPEYRYNADDPAIPNDPFFQEENVDYLSGLITSYDAFRFTHGYAESRVKLPAGKGFWPAFWLLTSFYVEDVPEIDIMEFLGDDLSTVYHTYHRFDRANDWTLVSTPSYTTNFDDVTADWHTFSVAWDPKEIVYYVDGVEARRITDENWRIPNQAMYLLANLAVGGSWPGSPDTSTPFPSEYEIDYIRVYQRDVPDVITPSVLASDYHLMFSDEFNGTQLNTQKWNTHHLWGPYWDINQEEQFYPDIGDTHADFEQNPIEVSGGTLKITAEPIDADELPPLPASDSAAFNQHPEWRQNTAYNNPNYSNPTGNGALDDAPFLPKYTSGILTTYDSFKFTHGYAEVNAKLPQGAGLWPAFWLLNGYYVDQQPEIDVIELRGSNPQELVHSYHHSPLDGAEPSYSWSTFSSDPDGFADDFHTYGVAWSPNQIDWYVDGVKQHTHTGASVSTQNMYAILNLAVGGNFVANVDESVLPSTFEVDYIRIYQTAGIPEAIASPPPPPPPEPEPPVEPPAPPPVVNLLGPNIESHQRFTLSQPSVDVWTELSFENTFTQAPVVIPSLLSSNEADAANVMVSEVSADGVWVKTGEWSNQDGAHADENISLLLLEPGAHDLGGLDAQAGTSVATGNGWTRVNFPQSFNRVPVVLAHLISGIDDVNSMVRLRDIDTAGFSVRLQREQLLGSTNEQLDLHYVAVETGVGEYQGKTVVTGITPRAVSQVPYEVMFGRTLENPVFYAQDQQVYGLDPGWVRLESISNTSARVFFQEETTRDAEVLHVAEQVGWLVMGEGVDRNDIQGPTVSSHEPFVLTQPNNEWTTIELSEDFSSAPVVIPSLLTSSDPEPAEVMLSEVTQDNLLVKTAEWEYQDGVHADENLSLFMLESGAHDLGGLKAEAGQALIGDGWTRINFANSFSQTPVVLAQLVSGAGEATATVRLRLVSSTGFFARIQNEEAIAALGGVRNLNFIAIDEGDGSHQGKGLSVGKTARLVSHLDHTVNFDKTFDNPAFYAQDQNSYGGDVSWVRLSNLSSASASIFIEEEQSANTETAHIAEVVGWAVVGDVENQTDVTLNLASHETFTLSQPNPTQWTTVDFSQTTFNVPITIPSLPLSADTEPSEIQLAYADNNDLLINAGEWEYQDGVHGDQDLSLFLLDAGSHDLGGLAAEASNVIVTSAWTRVLFNQSFDEAPVVIAHSIGNTDEINTTVRIRNVDSLGFDAKIQTQQATNPSGLMRTVNFIAVQSGLGEHDGRAIEVGRTARVVNHLGYDLVFAQSFNQPTLYAQDQQTYGVDVSWVGLTELNNNGAQIFLEEEQSEDTETAHIAESVGWVVVSNP